jgi:hypothetical protein
MCWQYICPGELLLLLVTNSFQSWTSLLVSRLKLVSLFLEIIVLACWAIWTSQNDFIFKDIVPNLYKSRRIFKDEMALHVHVAKRKPYSGFQSWVQNFV